MLQGRQVRFGGSRLQHLGIGVSHFGGLGNAPSQSPNKVTHVTNLVEALAELGNPDWHRLDEMLS
ncbi:hypothetical protein D3C80_2052570 [compost metagenome]